MNQTTKLGGVVVPLVIPITADGRLDFAALDRLIEFQIAGGVDGLLLLGTTGEGPCVPRALGRAFIECAVATVRQRLRIYVNVASLVVLPWTMRNRLVFDAFVPVSTAGALNLWQGNTHLTRQEVYEEYWAVRGRIPKYEHARQRALEAILERQPLWIREKLRSQLPEFWAAHAQPIVHIERGGYRRSPTAGARRRGRCARAVPRRAGPV